MVHGLRILNPAPTLTHHCTFSAPFVAVPQGSPAARWLSQGLPAARASWWCAQRVAYGGGKIHNFYCFYYIFQFGKFCGFLSLFFRHFSISAKVFSPKIPQIKFRIPKIPHFGPDFYLRPNFLSIFCYFGGFFGHFFCIFSACSMTYNVA